jgi:hypothetical protein
MRNADGVQESKRRACEFLKGAKRAKGWNFLANYAET